MTVTSKAQLRRLFRDAREHGYAVSDQEMDLGSIGVAAPVRNAAGEMIAALDLPAQVHNARAEDVKLKVEVVTPFKHLRVTYSGKVCLMKRPFDMALRAIPIMAMFAGERLAP